MSRPIDSDELLEILAGMQSACHTHAGLIYISKLWQQVKHMPTIDAVPVIRCKDCKYYTGKWCMRDSNKQLDENDRITTAMDYCSWAERKEE